MMSKTIRYLSVAIGTLGLVSGIAELGIVWAWSEPMLLAVLSLSLLVWLPAGAFIIAGLPARLRERLPLMKAVDRPGAETGAAEN
jgi:hypothetical protein